MAQQVRIEFMQIPVVTRVYTTACVLTTFAVVSQRVFICITYIIEIFALL